MVPVTGIREVGTVISHLGDLPGISAMTGQEVLTTGVQGFLFGYDNM